MEKCCKNCQYALPNELIGWRRCDAPLPYWAEGLKVGAALIDIDQFTDVEETDGKNCAAFNSLE